MSGSRKAIVDATAGSTRDRNVSLVEWNGKAFELVDTGGILEEVETPLDEQVGLQVETAIAEAQVVCWVVDGRTGLLPEEQYLAKRLRAIAERVVLAVNKIDTAAHMPAAGEFHRLGFSELFEVSAEHGLGVAELMDAITERISQTSEWVEPDEVRVAIAGRPNVGKSSLLNRLAGEQRAVVSEMAGTTRDAVDTLLEVDGQKYRFVDTAGIRRQGKIPNQADRLGVMYAERAIERAHLCLLILDATEGPTTEDASIGDKIDQAGRGAVLIFNKWDLIEGREAAAKELALVAREKLPHLDYAPIVFLSAVTGRGVVKGIFPRLRDVREQQLKRIPTPELNRFLETATTRLPPRAKDGKEVRLLYVTQTGVSPPRFVVFGNRSRSELDPTYPRYLVHRLREAFGFEGTPVRVAIRKRKGSNNQ
jgi:GTP-binding protein